MRTDPEPDAGNPVTGLPGVDTAVVSEDSRRLSEAGTSGRFVQAMDVRFSTLVRGVVSFAGGVEVIQMS